MTYTPRTSNAQFDEFKKAIYGIVEEMYNATRGKGLVEPIAFVGILPGPDLSKFKAIPSVKNMIKNIIKNEGPDAEPKIDKLILNQVAIMGCPLGGFFSVPDDVAQQAKEAAARMIKNVIAQLSEDDKAIPVFYAFVSEAFLKVCTMSEQDKIDLATGRIGKEEAAMRGVGNIRPSQDPASEEKVIIMFETRYSTTMTTYDLLLDEDIQFCELIKKNELPQCSDPGAGIFSGVMHVDNMGYSNN